MEIQLGVFIECQFSCAAWGQVRIEEEVGYCYRWGRDKYLETLDNLMTNRHLHYFYNEIFPQYGLSISKFGLICMILDRCLSHLMICNTLPLFLTLDSHVSVFLFLFFIFFLNQLISILNNLCCHDKYGVHRSQNADFFAPNCQVIILLGS